jgi:hypothetical protein
MNNMSFGITVPCFSGDQDLLSGCLESIKDHYPETPICLIPDGRFSLYTLMKRYGCSIITPDDVHPTLRQFSYGYGLTKMVAFWHAPFEYFLHIDADAICWGRFFDNALFQDHDFIANSPHEAVTDDLLSQQYFDFSLLSPEFQVPDIDRTTLFNSGTFGARRGMLSLDSYLALLMHMRNVAGSLFMDQGILNLMIQMAIRAGEIRYLQQDLQAVVAVSALDELERNFAFLDRKPDTTTQPRLIHWAGAKPRGWPRRQCSYVRPMDYHRLKHAGLSALFATPASPLVLHVLGSAQIFKARLENRINRSAGSRQTQDSYTSFF